MTDDVIGSITGTATFERVTVRDHGDDQTEVVGEYQGDTTTYRTETERVFFNGLSLMEIDGEVVLEPQDGGWMMVRATEDELRMADSERGVLDHD